jgi:hypothetical protein
MAAVVVVAVLALGLLGNQTPVVALAERPDRGDVRMHLPGGSADSCTVVAAAAARTMPC